MGMGAYQGLGDGLGDFRADLISVLSIPLGHDRAVATVAEFEASVRAKAQEGTNAAIDAKIPVIRATVQAQASKIVTPLFWGAIAAGSLGALLGLVAAVKAKKCRK